MKFANFGRSKTYPNNSTRVQKIIFILLNEFVLIDFVSILGVNLNQAIFVYTLCFLLRSCV